MHFRIVDKRHHLRVAFHLRVRGGAVLQNLDAHNAKAPNITRGGELLRGQAFWRRPPHWDDARRAAVGTYANSGGRVKYHGICMLSSTVGKAGAGLNRDVQNDSQRRVLLRQQSPPRANGRGKDESARYLR